MTGHKTSSLCCLLLIAHLFNQVGLKPGGNNGTYFQGFTFPLGHTPQDDLAHLNVVSLGRAARFVYAAASFTAEVAAGAE